MIIDLGHERDRRDGPDEDTLAFDAYGRKLFTFLIDYELDGRQFSVRIFAPDFTEAERHSAALRRSAVVAGQLYCEGEC